MESTLQPEILYWKGAMGIRDIIVHHYFDIDGDTVLDVIKSDLPPLLETLGRMQEYIVADKI